MKPVLICGLSSRQNNPYPWFDLLGVAKETWDSVDMPGVTTVFHLGTPASPLQDRVVAFDIPDSLATLGYRNLAAFRFLLDNDPEWAYMARINSSCYCSKRRLLEFCQKLPDTGAVVGGGGRMTGTESDWMWGGLQFIFSRDVVQAMADHGDEWDHTKMEDVGMSHLIFKLGYEAIAPLGSGGIDAVDGRWLLQSQSLTPSFAFDDVSEIKEKTNCHFIRVKQDGKRHLDSWFMRELLAKYDS